jgi:hypothetical protein
MFTSVDYTFQACSFLTLSLLCKIYFFLNQWSLWYGFVWYLKTTGEVTYLLTIKRNNYSKVLKNGN